jgi:hypothetical protein
VSQFHYIKVSPDPHPLAGGLLQFNRAFSAWYGSQFDEAGVFGCDTSGIVGTSFQLVITQVQMLGYLVDRMLRCKSNGCLPQDRRDGIAASLLAPPLLKECCRFFQGGSSVFVRVTWAGLLSFIEEI